MKKKRTTNPQQKSTDLRTPKLVNSSMDYCCSLLWYPTFHLKGNNRQPEGVLCSCVSPRSIALEMRVRTAHLVQQGAPYSQHPVELGKIRRNRLRHIFHLRHARAKVLKSLAGEVYEKSPGKTNVEGSGRKEATGPCAGRAIVVNITPTHPPLPGGHPTLFTNPFIPYLMLNFKMRQNKTLLTTTGCLSAIWD